MATDQESRTIAANGKADGAGSEEPRDLAAEMRRLAADAHAQYTRVTTQLRENDERHRQALDRADQTQRVDLSQIERSLKVVLEKAQRDHDTEVASAEWAKSNELAIGAEAEKDIRSDAETTQEILGSYGSGNLLTRESINDHPKKEGSDIASMKQSLAAGKAKLLDVRCTAEDLGRFSTLYCMSKSSIVFMVIVSVVLGLTSGWNGFFAGLLFFGPIVGAVVGVIWGVAARSWMKTTLRTQLDEARDSVSAVLIDAREMMAGIEHRYTTQATQLHALHQRRSQDARATHDRDSRSVQDTYASAVTTATSAHEERKAGLLKGYARFGTTLIAQMEAFRAEVDGHGPDWSQSGWASWQLTQSVRPAVRLGTISVHAGLDNGQPRMASLPVVQNAPQGLCIAFRSHGAKEAHVPEALLIRVLTAIPAGKLRFTLIDPVGLGSNVAALMHLSDDNADLVTDRAWVEPTHITQRLSELSEQMQTINQKYLRKQFTTMEEYNAEAGNIEEPYRVLVINNFPMNFQEESLRHLVNIVNTGPKCGVYTLLAIDDALKQPNEFSIDGLLDAASMVLTRTSGQTAGTYTVRTPVLPPYPLEAEEPPSPELVRTLVDRVGNAARANRGVKVPFADIAPPPDRWWTEDSTDRLCVPIGIFGARKPQLLTFGRTRQGEGSQDGGKKDLNDRERAEDVHNSALIVGGVGAGKSTLHHVAVMSLAMHYSPAELELYLLDFKQGVEFKTYAVNRLPHARVIAVESEREFALSVLQRLDRELEARGKLFRDVTEQFGESASITRYRHQTGKTLPRIVVLIDEYQELFTADDALAQSASVVLERLVRQGRAYGIHLMLSTQSLAGNANINRASTQGLMHTRIALRSSDSDARLVLAEDNPAARLLSRAGEAIYNNRAGRLEGNNRFQTAWLSPEDRDAYIKIMTARAATEFPDLPPAVVFEGSVPARVETNRRMAALLAGTGTLPKLPTAWLGDPVAIADPVGPAFQPQAGANVVIVGQDDALTYGMMSAALAALARQHELRNDGAAFEVVDMGSTEEPGHTALRRVAEAFPAMVAMASRRRLVDRIEHLHSMMKERSADEERGIFPPVYLVVTSLQRARDLREEEGSSGFSLDPVPVASPRQMLASILRDGPDVGIHVLLAVDAFSNLSRVIDTYRLTPFDHRIALQMSETDSNNLIGSKAAVTLGGTRAILYSDERGTSTKFRPYGLPSETWLELLDARTRDSGSIGQAGR